MLPVSHQQLREVYGLSPLMVVRLKSYVMEQKIAHVVDLHWHGEVIDEVLYPMACQFMDSDTLVREFVRALAQSRDQWMPQRKLEKPAHYPVNQRMQAMGLIGARGGQTDAVQTDYAAILQALAQPTTFVALAKKVGIYYSKLEKYLIHLRDTDKLHVCDWKETLIGCWVPVYLAGKGDSLVRPSRERANGATNLPAYFDKIEPLLLPLLPMEAQDLVYGLGLSASRVKALVPYWQKKGVVNAYKLHLSRVHPALVLFPMSETRPTDEDLITQYQALRASRPEDIWRATEATEQLHDRHTQRVNAIPARKANHETPWVHGSLTSHLNQRFF